MCVSLLMFYKSLLNASINVECASKGSVSFSCFNSFTLWRMTFIKYERHLESKERFAIKTYLLIIEKKKNMQVLSQLHLLLHIVILDIEALVVP